MQTWFSGETGKLTSFEHRSNVLADRVCIEKERGEMKGPTTLMRRIHNREGKEGMGRDGHERQSFLHVMQEHETYIEHEHVRIALFVSVRPSS